MALIKCEECRREVSDKAVACPGCGAPIVAPSPKTTGPGVSASATKQPKKDNIGKNVLIGLAVILGLCTLLPKKQDPGATSPQPVHTTACAVGDLSCLGNRGIVSAGVYCRSAVERLARHSVKWTDRTFESKFSRFRWRDQALGEITYVGDKAEFQNGYGAYTPVIYECDLAADEKTVLDVRLLREGRLP